MASVAERQKAFRRRLEAEGMAQISGFVPGRHFDDVRLLIERLRNDPALTVGPLRNVVTGKLEPLRKKR